MEKEIEPFKTPSTFQDLNISQREDLGVVLSNKISPSQELSQGSFQQRINDTDLRIPNSNLSGTYDSNHFNKLSNDVISLKSKDNYQKEKAKDNESKELSIFVGGISGKTKDSDIRDLFKKFGTIIRIKRARSKGGAFRGYCFIKFETREQVSKALESAGNI